MARGRHGLVFRAWIIYGREDSGFVNNLDVGFVPVGGMPTCSDIVEVRWLGLRLVVDWIA